MASKALSRRLVASLSVLGLLLSSLLVIVPMTAPAAEQPNTTNPTSTSTTNSTNSNSAKPAVNSTKPSPSTSGKSATASQAAPFNFQDPSAGVPQSLRSPIPMRGGVPSDPRFTYNGTEITGLTDAGKTDLQNNHELAIPDGTTKIAADVFSGLKLTKVTLPASVTEVGDRAFYDNSITDLVAPGLETIGEGAFQKNQLTTFTSDTIISIGEGAFSDNQLTKVNITDARPDDPQNPPQRLTIISANAFRDNKLTEVTLPKYVTEIGASAFANNQLSGIAFPPNLEKVGQEAFSGNQIKEVKIPATITTFGKEVFSNNKRWVVLEKADEHTPLPTAVKSEKYASGFGQVAAEDAVSITIKYVDAETKKPLRSQQVLQSEFTEPDGVYFAGKENTIKAPRLAGYAVTPTSQKITPKSGEENAVTFTYKKTDFSPKISGEINKHIPHRGDGSTEALLKDVTAVDTYGNVITEKLKVSPKTIDTNVQEATYDVYYTVTDSQGRTKTVKGKVAVGPDWPEKTICAGWQVKDFTYNGGTISGFSRDGNQKHMAGKTKDPWCWPTFGDKGQPITAIGDNAFSDMYPSLSRIPDSWGSITSIGNRAFASSSFTEMPKSWDKVSKIGDSAFASSRLTALPKSWGKVTSIGESAFNANSNLSEIPDSWGSVKAIGKNAFRGGALTRLPDSWGLLTEINEGVFGANKLQSLPKSWENITSIGKEAFFSNTNLTALPDSWGNVSQIGETAFYNCGLTSLPNSWGKITTLPRYAFKENKLVSLPDWGPITSVGQEVFRHNQLTELPESWENVSQLGVGAFQDNKLKAVPDSWGKLTRLPKDVFENNEITSLHSLGSITSIGESAFKNNEITSLHSWGSVTTIGKSAFEKNKLVKLPDSWENVSRLDTSSFASNLLTSLPDSWGKITTIPERAFYDNQLAALPAWGAVTTIGQSAFVRNNLTVLPPQWDSVTTIGECAFAGKSTYKYFNVNSDNLPSCSGGDANAANNNQIQALPDSWGQVKTIKGRAFLGNALTGLPDSWGSVTTIGAESFKDNKLTALTAPWDNFTEIPTGAFINNEITTLPSSWGKITLINRHAFESNRIKALPASWGAVTAIKYSAFVNNALTALPDSWENVESVGAYWIYSMYGGRENYAGTFGNVTDSFSKNKEIDREKGKNNITTLPNSLGKINDFGQYTFGGTVPAGQVFTVPDTPVDQSNPSGDPTYKPPRNRLDLAVRILGAKDLYLDTYVGLKAPIYLRPESGKNPLNIEGIPGVIIILVDNKVNVQYLGPNGETVAPSESRVISTKDSNGENKYLLQPPMVKGYSLPQPQWIDLDGNDKNIVFRYQKAPAELTGFYARLNLTGKINQPGWPESNDLEEQFGNNMRVDLAYGGDAGTSIVKDGVIRVTYDPTRVEVADWDNTSSQYFQSVKVVAPGVLEVKLKPNYDSSIRTSIPIYWRIKKRITASDAVFPLKAELLDKASDGNRYVLTPHPKSKPGPVNLKGYYPLPTFTKDTVGCDLGVCRDYDDDPEGHVSRYGNNAVTFTFAVEKLMRNVRGYTITDQLPLYIKTDGTQARAKFVASENPGWKLGDDQVTLTYTNTEKRLTTESSGLGSLKLHFPGAKKQKRIDNTAEFTLTPEEQGPKEPLITGAANTHFSFYKPMETAPPGVPLTKVAAGPHIRDGVAVIYDTKQDRIPEFNWNVLTNNTTDTAVTLNLRDFDLDDRLQYTAITPDPVFVGGTLEIISPTGEPGKYKVLYSMGITGTDRIDLPENLTSYENIQLRWSSVKETQPRERTITRIHTKLRDPDQKLCEGLKCQADLRNKVQGGERIKEAHVKVLPEGKKLKARKVNTFAKATIAGKTGTYTVGAELETDYGDPLTAFELVDVLPRGLEVNRVTLTKKFAELPGARYQILSNFNGTGRVAVRFQADQVTDPNQVYSVGQLQTVITRGVIDGDIINEAFVHAQGNVEYPEDKSDREKDRWVTRVTNPIAGSGVWSRAENTTRVAVGDETYITKRIRERKPNTPWVTEISTVGGAKFDYQLRLGYGTNPEQNPVIYDLLPVAGTPARKGSTLINQYDSSGRISFEMADGTAANGWNTFYTCDTGMATKYDLDRANWQSAPCQAVTGLKFTNTSPQKPRSEVRITVPMIAGPKGATPLSQEHLGKKAINDFWSVSSSHEGKLESNPVINTLVPPATNIELTKYGYKAEPFQTAQKKLLAGAKFGLYDKEGELQATAISDSNGKVKFTNVNAAPGWTVREIEAPTGYAVTDKAYMLSATDFNATNFDSATGTYRIKAPDVTNMGKWYPVEPIRGTAEFKKVDKNGQPLAGIAFTITPQPVQQNDGTMFVPNSAPITVRSNDDGDVKFYNIPAGKWRLTENPGDRHLQPIAPIDFTITNCSGSDCVLRGLNLTFGFGDLGLIFNDKGAVSLSKLGVRGMAGKNKSFGQWKRSDGVIKGGATFELYKGTTDSATNRVKTVTTASDGQMNVILDGLDLDQVYTLKETFAPAGYIKNDALLQFQIDAAGKLKDASGNLLLEQDELLVPNEKEKKESSLIVTKVDPQAAATNRNLKGAEFGLFKQAGDGSWPTEPIKKVTTEQTGQAEFTGLSGGIYRVKELKAPAGYYIDPRAQYEFVVDDYKMQQFTWTANNNRSRLRVFKFEPLVKAIGEDAADKVVSGTPGAVKVPGQVAGTFDVVIPLSGAKFTLFNEDETTEVATNLVTGSDGLVNLPANVKLDPDKIYKLKEIQAPSGGYIAKSNAISVKVSDYALLDGFTGLITMEVPNTKDTGRITVSKLSKETGKPLAGAEFTLKDKTDNTERSLTTNEVGLATFTGLPFGHDYELRESKPPDGYLISNAVEPISLTADNPVITFKRYNELSETEVELNKVSDTGTAIEGVVFELSEEGASGAAQTLTTDKNGKVKFKVTPGQNYTLKEIQTSRGYALLPQPVNFTVDGNGNVTIISGKGNVNTVKGGNGSLTVTNYPEGNLPLSGYAGSLEVLLLGCLVLGIAIVFTLFERKRK
ncbi:SpaA isopeptide-forming pilin-related protein [Varibaculum cambriense]|uniref:SpaA isopeptide-forming pilin-related protein n=1 Tax=Varibaculum cambriense TaxID=184870 RepID=UPI00243125FE|nr:SpaA isopeptide-forming pilin-related protein [Varibaculum cambriense]